MKEIPAQIHRITKTVMGETLITFRVDEMYTDTIQELFLKKIGTEFKMKLEDVSPETVLGSGNDDSRERFMKQLCAKMNEYMNKTGMAETDCKEQLFDKLQELGIKVHSRTELGLKGLAIAIGIVDKWLNE